jgi:hypothetical protein
MQVDAASADTVTVNDLWTPFGALEDADKGGDELEVRLACRGIPPLKCTGYALSYLTRTIGYFDPLFGSHK